MPSSSNNYDTRCFRVAAGAQARVTRRFHVKSRHREKTTKSFSPTSDKSNNSQLRTKIKLTVALDEDENQQKIL